jgi:hypothetical protein
VQKDFISFLAGLVFLVAVVTYVLLKPASGIPPQPAPIVRATITLGTAPIPGPTRAPLPELRPLLSAVPGDAVEPLRPRDLQNLARHGARY